MFQSRLRDSIGTQKSIRTMKEGVGLWIRILLIGVISLYKNTFRLFLGPNETCRKMSPKEDDLM